MIRSAALRGRINLFEDAGSGGVPVLLLHEPGGGSESWKYVIPPLPTDRRVIAVDLRCAGGSEKLPGEFSLADAAGDPDAPLSEMNLSGAMGAIGGCERRRAGLFWSVRCWLFAPRSGYAGSWCGRIPGSRPFDRLGSARARKTVLRSNRATTRKAAGASDYRPPKVPLLGRGPGKDGSHRGSLR